MAPFIKIFSAISHALNPAHALALNLALVLALALTHALNPAHNLTHALALNLSSIVPLLVNYWSQTGRNAACRHFHKQIEV